MKVSILFTILLCATFILSAQTDPFYACKITYRDTQRTSTPGYLQETARLVSDSDHIFILGSRPKGKTEYGQSVKDRNGEILLLDDATQSKLIMMVNKLNAGYVQLSVYSRSARCVFRKTLVHAPQGTQIDVDYSQLPGGIFTVVAKSDHGRIIRKKFLKSSRNHTTSPSKDVFLANQ